MAKNYVQRGDVLTVPAPATVAAGDVVILGEIVGVAAGDAASGNSLDLETVGVWELPKEAAAISLGAVVYWDSGAELCTATATDNTRIGVAVADGALNATSVRVKLDG